jgi:hypothetical protein
LYFAECEDERLFDDRYTTNFPLLISCVHLILFVLVDDLASVVAYWLRKVMRLLAPRGAIVEAAEWWARTQVHHHEDNAI